MPANIAELAADGTLSCAPHSRNVVATRARMKPCNGYKKIIRVEPQLGKVSAVTDVVGTGPGRTAPAYTLTWEYTKKVS